jgi:hypothetical protein
MPYVFSFLSHTPIWVFPLFAYLIWQGIKSLRPRTQPIWRLLIVPSFFVLWSLSRIIMRHYDSPWPLLAWFTAALLLTPLAFFCGPRRFVMDRQNGRVTRSGSPFPLIRNVTLFTLQYGSGVADAFQSDGHTAVATISRAVSGATAGYFIGWSLMLLMRYWDYEERTSTD